MAEKDKVTLVMEPGPIKMVEFDREELHVVQKLIEERILRTRRKKTPNIVDFIIVHALEQLLKKIAN